MKFLFFTLILLEPVEPPEEQLAMQYDVPIESSSSDSDDMSSSMHFSENMLARFDTIDLDTSHVSLNS